MLENQVYFQPYCETEPSPGPRFKSTLHFHGAQKSTLLTLFKVTSHCPLWWTNTSIKTLLLTALLQCLFMIVWMSEGHETRDISAKAQISWHLLGGFNALCTGLHYYFWKYFLLSQFKTWGRIKLCRWINIKEKKSMHTQTRTQAHTLKLSVLFVANSYISYRTMPFGH